MKPSDLSLEVITNNSAGSNDCQVNGEKTMKRNNFRSTAEAVICVGTSAPAAPVQRRQSCASWHAVPDFRPWAEAWRSRNMPSPAQLLARRMWRSSRRRRPAWTQAGRSQGMWAWLLPALVLILGLPWGMHFTSLGFSSSSHLLFVIFSEQDCLLIHVYTVTSTMRPWSCLRPLGMTVIQTINHHHKTGLHRSIISVITHGWSVSSSQTHGKVRETMKGQKKWIHTEKRRCWMALKYF